MIQSFVICSSLAIRKPYLLLIGYLYRWSKMTVLLIISIHHRILIFLIELDDHLEFGNWHLADSCYATATFILNKNSFLYKYYNLNS